MHIPSPPDHAWFDHDRFGLFVHFGLYSVAGRHEWVMTRERTPADEYARYAEVFDPDRFDAADIARRAKAAGMRYVVLTTKHHDGFCLWDSGETTYTSVTACGRDLVAEFVAAVRAEGLRVGLYHSVIDWRHPDYTIDYHHPRRDDPDAREQNETKDFSRYRAYLHAQVRELLTAYGDIDYLFFDFTYAEDRDGWRGKYPADWDATALLAMCRELQPAMLVNDRLGIPADLVTPEQYQPDEPMTVDGAPVRWEACQTLNGSWGYDRDNVDFKSTDLLIRTLGDTVAKGGNMLLNIGPDGRGAITDPDRTTLARIGAWMDVHGDSIRGAGPSRIPAPPGVVVTQRGDRAYLHLHVWPFGHLHLPGMASRVRFARMLHDGAEIHRTETDPDQPAWNTQPGGRAPGTLTLTIPTRRPDVAVPVIELYLK